MAADYLPQEILADIFHRLPIKSIGSSICVSKYWLSIIKTPDFVSDHFNIQQRISSHPHPHPLFIVRLCPGHALNIHYSLRYDDYYFTRYSKLRPPSNFNNHSFSLVGSSRGLLCLMHNLYTYNYTIVLWNPSIGKTFNLPLPCLTFDTHGAFEALLGFGFDSATQDYKVVRILRLLERDDVEIEVEVFSLKSRSWKRIVSPRAPQYSIVERGSQAFVNGSVHWVATIRNEGNGRDKNLIVGFQLGDERFRELQLPESLEMESPIFLTVSPYMDSTIAVFRRNYLTRSDTEIWVMSEYGSVDSWVRLLTVGMYENGVPRALGFRSNGDVLFELSGGEIVSGDPESFEVRELELQGEVGYSVVCSFEETLVLLDK